MTNTELLCLALGWQGGTVHQVAAETGLMVNQIVDTDRKVSYINDEPTIYGLAAAMTCGLEYNKKVNFPQNKGNLAFWMGVAYGQEIKLKYP